MIGEELKECLIPAGISIIAMKKINTIMKKGTFALNSSKTRAFAETRGQAGN